MTARVALGALCCALFLSTGCGENPLVGEVESLRDEMCACSDQDCADSVLKKLKEFDKANKGKKVSRQDNDKMQKLYVEVSDCLGKVILKTRESNEAKPPAPVKETAPAAPPEEGEVKKEEKKEPSESEATPEEPPKAVDAPE